MRFAEQHPLIEPFHRVGGKPGKAAALKDAMTLVKTEVVLIFDADYIPGKALLRQLVAPFFDPEIGAVMGRVVPLNVGKKCLTRLLDLERSGGYQVDQQARMNLHLVPQYGGTVAGVRKSALQEIGGWNENALAEDTDLTYRLLIAGWKTAYENRAECYEEVPERWPVRVRQITRWAKGHNQAMASYIARTARCPGLGWFERIDGRAAVRCVSHGTGAFVGMVARGRAFLYRSADRWRLTGAGAGRFHHARKLCRFLRDCGGGAARWIAATHSSSAANSFRIHRESDQRFPRCVATGARKHLWKSLRQSRTRVGQDGTFAHRARARRRAIAYGSRVAGVRLMLPWLRLR